MLSALAFEARRRRMALGVAFTLIAIVALVVGSILPRKYMASITILAQESSIITPLMEGAATATANTNRAGIARDVIYSRKVMNGILAAGGWLAGNPSPIEQDRLIKEITLRTTVKIEHDKLITITYYDSDRKRAFIVTQQFAKLFINESLASKRKESRDAYDFINSEVEAYRHKLTDAEDKLKTYRDANVDARSGNGVETNLRISQLRSQIENSRIDLTEKRSQQAALQSQLSGESEVSAVQTTQGVNEVRVAELQDQLAKLQLTYTDQYPDVIRVRHQIQDLRQQIAQSEQRHQSALLAGTPVALDNSAQMNPFYQHLQVQLSATRGDVASTSARIGASELMLASEQERSLRIAGSQNVTSELNRDYNVNRDVYQDLLKRRENARVSMNLDAEQRGLTFIIQSPAEMPLTPTGLRPINVSLNGLLLSLAIPLGLLVALVRFDPRVRSAEQLELETGLNVLQTIPFYSTPDDRRRFLVQNSMLVLLVAGVAVIYFATFLHGMGQ